MSIFPSTTLESGLVENNLQLHLDANDASSYPGGGQIWYDLTDNNYDFYLGQTGSEESTDPTFNSGTPAYFEAGTRSFFIMDSPYSGSILRTIGRQDQEFTIEMWVYWVDGYINRGILGNNAGSSSDGLGMWEDFSGRWVLRLDQIAASDMYVIVTHPADSQWQQCVWTGRHDGATTCSWYLDATLQDTYTYNANWIAADGDSTAFMFLFACSQAFDDPAFAGPDNIASPGSRLSIVRMYDRILDASEITRNFNNNRSTFGI